MTQKTEQSELNFISWGKL